MVGSKGEGRRIEEQVIGWLAQQRVAAYLVGGCVRDRILGRPIYDLDVAVERGGLALARRLADHFQGAYYPLDSERDTGRAILPVPQEQPVVVDVVGFRGPDLASDLADRDFTINALAANVRTPEEVVDLHNGLRDLKDGVIRPVSDAAIRNDPLRALRAVRQAAQLGFRLAPETETLIRRDGQALTGMAGERVRDELARILALPYAAPCLEQLDHLGLLALILPELEPLRGLEQPPPHHLPALAHSLETVRVLEHLVVDLLPELGLGAGWEAIGRGPFVPAEVESLAPFASRLAEHLREVLGDTRPRLVTLKLAALLHDTGKPARRSVDKLGRIRFLGHQAEGARIARAGLGRLRFNRREVQLAETIVRHHMRPLLLAKQDSVSKRAVYRFFRDTREAGVDVLLHALADQGAIYDVTAGKETWSRLVALTARMFADYWEHPDERVSPPTLVNGRDLMGEFGLRPGPRIGELLEAVREAQISGEIADREEALAFVSRKLAEGHEAEGG